MPKIIIVYHSGYGHTEVVARHIQIGMKNVGIEAKLIKATEADQNWEAFNEADAIVFGCPTYMGSASAPFKAFMDSTSKIWQLGKWKNKIAAGFTNSSGYSGDKLSTLIQLAVFAGQHGMIWVGLDLLAGNSSSKGSPEDMNRVGSFLGLMTQSNQDEGPDVAPPMSDRKTAEYFGTRIVSVTKKMISEI